MSAGAAFEGAVVVLGHENDDDGALSPVARARADAALEVWRSHPSWRVLPTGGWGRFNRSPAMHGTHVGASMIERGLDPAAVLPVAPSVCTVEDATMSKPILAEHRIDRIAVVSCSLHMARVEAVFSAAFADFDEVAFHTAESPRRGAEAEEVRDAERGKLASWIAERDRNTSRRVFLLQMSGPPGTGKSSIARLVGETTGAAVLDFDVVKSALLHGGTPWPAAGPSAHQLVRALANDLLRQGISVIVDSCSAYASVPAAGTAIAWARGAAYAFVDCWAPPDVIGGRLAQRSFRRSQRMGHDRPPAEWVPDLPGRPVASSESGLPASAPWARVDTTRPAGDCVAEVLDYLESVRSGRLGLSRAARIVAATASSSSMTSG